MDENELNNWANILKTKLNNILSSNLSDSEKEQKLKELANEYNIPTLSFNTQKINKLKETKQNLDDLANNLNKIISNSSNSKFDGLQNLMNVIGNIGLEKANEKDLLSKLATPYFEEESIKLTEDCFHYNQSECEGGIIDAHSIQKSGALDRISKEKNNRKSVIHFQIGKAFKWETNEISINQASTFRGFCKKHDELFFKVEKGDYDKSDEQNFIHSYRSFAYSYYQAIKDRAAPLNLVENLTGNLEDLIKNLSSLASSFLDISILDKDKLSLPKITSEQEELLALTNFEPYKKLLNDYLKNNLYYKLDYLVYELDYLAPIVCASWIRTDISIPGFYIVDQTSTPYVGYPIILTVFNTSDDKSTVILSRFKKDIATEILFNHLRSLSEKEFELQISSMIFKNVKNFYLAPKYWDSISVKKKKEITEYVNREKISFPFTDDFIEKINLFENFS